jgi:hypothetical protein
MQQERQKDTGTPKTGNGKSGIEREIVIPIVEPQQQNNELPPTLYNNKKWYVYDDNLGFYRHHEDNYICHLVQKILGWSANSHQITDFVSRVRYSSHYLDRFYPAVRFDSDDIIINMTNGLTRVNSGGVVRLEQQDPRWCFNQGLPIPYDPDATCPTFDEELQTKLPDPLDQKLILLFGAYCLIPDCRFGITLFNYGPSHTGKSTIIVHGLGAVFGDLIGSLKLNEICPESYSGISHVPMLADKLINVGSEIDGREVKDTTNFKRLISGETVVAREAFERGGAVLTFCKLTFNMNELPKINGTIADIDRIRIVFFNEVTEYGKRTFEIEQRIKTEGSGIFNRLLEYMPEALKLTEFPYGSLNSQWIYDQLKEKIDPFQHFMHANAHELELGPRDYTMYSTEIDPMVIEFLRNNNYDSIFHLDIFKRRLYARFNIKSEQQWRPLGIPRAQQRRVSVLYGIRLRSRPTSS